MAICLGRRHAIAEIVVAHHVTIARRGVAVAAIVAVFAHRFLTLRTSVIVIASAFARHARYARYASSATRLTRLFLTGRLDCFIAGGSGAGLYLARRATTVAIAIAPAIAATAPAVARRIARAAGVGRNTRNTFDALGHDRLWHRL